MSFPQILAKVYDEIEVEQSFFAAVEFVTKVTSDACVKNFGLT